MIVHRLRVLCVAFSFLMLGVAGRAAPTWHFEDPAEKNVIYGMDHGTALLLDVYRPAKPNGYALIAIMGTGFTAEGEYDDVPLKDAYRGFAEHGVFPPLFGGTGHFFGPALEAGFTVFSINHRLGPKYPWRIQVRDCQRAVQFIRHHATHYGINPAAIGGLGHSSGATMTSCLAVLDDIADPKAADPVNRESSRIQAAVVASGVYDLLAYREQRPGLSVVLVGLVGRTILFQPPGHPIYADYREASVISHVTKDDAPFLLFHGDADPIVDSRQSVAMDAALVAAGVPHELVIIPGGDHGQPKTPMSPTPGERAATWFLQQLKAKP